MTDKTLPFDIRPALEDYKASIVGTVIAGILGGAFLATIGAYFLITPSDSYNWIHVGTIIAVTIILFAIIHNVDNISGAKKRSNQKAGEARLKLTAYFTSEGFTQEQAATLTHELTDTSVNVKENLASLKLLIAPLQALRKQGLPANAIDGVLGEDGYVRLPQPNPYNAAWLKLTKDLNGEYIIHTLREEDAAEEANIAAMLGLFG